MKKKLPFGFLVCLVMVFVACSNYKDSDNGNIFEMKSKQDKNETITNENGKIICMSDITHDGSTDEIIIDYSGTQVDDQKLVSIKVYSDSGEKEIWETSLALPHAGWGTYYIVEQNEEKELLYYIREDSQGEYACYYKLFHLNNTGQEEIIDEYSIETEDDIKLFDKRTKEYLDNSVLLISTYGGELNFFISEK